MNCWQCKKETTNRNFCPSCGAPLGEILRITQDEEDVVARVRISTGEIYRVVFEGGKRVVLKKQELLNKRK